MRRSWTWHRSTPPALNREFEDKLALTVIRRGASDLFLPAPVMSALAVIRSAKYIKEGLMALWHRKLSVAVLDATAVTVSMVRGDFATAGSVMFMLRLGEILEEWTHKKSVPDLASAMSLRIENAWQQVDGTEVLTKVTDVKLGDRIVIRAAAQYLHIGHRFEKHDRSAGGTRGCVIAPRRGVHSSTGKEIFRLYNDFWDRFLPTIQRGESLKRYLMRPLKNSADQ